MRSSPRELTVHPLSDAGIALERPIPPRSSRCRRGSTRSAPVSPSTTSAGTARPTPSPWPACSARSSRCRSGSSERSGRRPTSRCSAPRSTPPSRSAAPATCPPCSTRATPGPWSRSRARCGPPSAARGAMQIRRATYEDVEPLARVHVRSWQVAYRGLIPDETLDKLDVAEWAARWRPTFETSDQDVLVAVDRGTIRGFCSLQPSRDETEPRETVGEITSLYVDPGTGAWAWAVRSTQRLPQEPASADSGAGARGQSRCAAFYERMGSSETPGQGSREASAAASSSRRSGIECGCRAAEEPPRGKGLPQVPPCPGPWARRLWSSRDRTGWPQATSAPGPPGPASPGSEGRSGRGAGID
jgi:hypothetical protein